MELKFTMKLKLLTLAYLISSFTMQNIYASESESDLNKRIRIHDILLKIYLAKHQIKLAIQEYQILLKLSPDNPALEYAFANYLYKNNNIKESIIHYRKACESAPDNADYQARLGSILLYVQDYDGAVTSFTNACRIGGARFQPQLNSAMQYQAQKRASATAEANAKKAKE